MKVYGLYESAAVKVQTLKTAIEVRHASFILHSLFVILRGHSFFVINPLTNANPIVGMFIIAS